MPELRGGLLMSVTVAALIVGLPAAPVALFAAVALAEYFTSVYWRARFRADREKAAAEYNRLLKRGLRREGQKWQALMRSRKASSH